MKKALLAGAVLGVFTFAFVGIGTAQSPIILRASHQFPGGKGDARDEMVQIIALEAKAANVGLDIQVFPGASLFKPNDQWNALTGGQLDISSFPLDYASGKIRAFGATLMPGMVFAMSSWCVMVFLAAWLASRAVPCFRRSRVERNSEVCNVSL
jgi:TRAP-type C4-dicarboxylate transport system substrate-binding protein